ncbi:MAG: DUF4335 domain-containing protein [Cyanobacteria bacterium J06559_1]
MSIQRQYQLPNCSLTLDGLSIDPTPGQEDVMSLLVNAECRISGLERSLNGGYNFFAALVRAVSQYGQEVLSGYAHPQVIEGEPLLVHINPGDGPYHHLVVQPEIADLGESGDGRAIDIKLSAVQLFDLTEAVDQFFDDTQTLPELEPALSPLPRRFVRTDEPLSDRALPAVLGVGSLVAATMALGLLPVPELRDPSIDTRAPGAEIELADGTTDGANSEPPSGASDPNEPEVSSITAANPSSPIWDLSPKITDEAKVADLQQQLATKINDEISPDTDFTEPLDYQVAVNEGGDVVGFRFNNEAASRNIDRTPLPRLARGNADAAEQENQAIAQYQVAFTPDGVEVNPAQAGTTVASAELETPAVETAETKTADAEVADTETAVASTGDAENSDAKNGEDSTDNAQDFSSYDEFAADEKPGSTDSATADSATAEVTANAASATFASEPPATLRSLYEVETLNNKLKRTIVDNRERPRVGSDAASYRVRITEDGTITGYQPVATSDAKAVGETPLPTLVASASEDAPSVDYRVVFTERGVVEVSPWWGWSYYE